MTTSTYRTSQPGSGQRSPSSARLTASRLRLAELLSGGPTNTRSTYQVRQQSASFRAKTLGIDLEPNEDRAAHIETHTDTNTHANSNADIDTVDDINPA